MLSTEFFGKLFVRHIGTKIYRRSPIMRKLAIAIIALVIDEQAVNVSKTFDNGEVVSRSHQFIIRETTQKKKAGVTPAFVPH